MVGSQFACNRKTDNYQRNSIDKPEETNFSFCHDAIFN